ncbi:MAG: hypothetical protein HC821_00480 [Lewinella sp.]|nr:hypothetical protein [Lewinella sp.]
MKATTMSLINAPRRFNATQRLLLGVLGLFVFLATWWGLAELLAKERPW